MTAGTLHDRRNVTGLSPVRAPQRRKEVCGQARRRVPLESLSRAVRAIQDHDAFTMHLLSSFSPAARRTVEEETMGARTVETRARSAPL